MIAQPFAIGERVTGCPTDIYKRVHFHVCVKDAGVATSSNRRLAQDVGSGYLEGNLRLDWIFVHRRRRVHGNILAGVHLDRGSLGLEGGGGRGCGLVANWHCNRDYRDRSGRLLADGRGGADTAALLQQRRLGRHAARLDWRERRQDHGDWCHPCVAPDRDAARATWSEAARVAPDEAARADPGVAAHQWRLDSSIRLEFIGKVLLQFRLQNPKNYINQQIESVYRKH